MTALFDVTLQVGELAVLSALLGYSSLVGIDRVSLHLEEADLNSFVISSAESLKRERRMKYGTDGKLLIQRELLEAVSCLGDAEKILHLSEKPSGGKRESLWVLKRKSGPVTICRPVAEAYRLTLCDSFDPSDRIRALWKRAKPTPFSFSLPLAEAENIREDALSFRVEKAKARLLSLLPSGEDAERMLAVLTGRADTLELRLFRRKSGFYEASAHRLFAVSGTCAMTVTPDERERIHFEAVDSDRALAALCPLQSEF